MVLSNKNNLRVLSALVIGISIPLGILMLKRWRSGGQPVTAETSLAADADPDQPISMMQHDDGDPLAGAEVYVAFGRRNMAQDVLDSAIESGRISEDDAALFWAKHDLKRTTVALNRTASEIHGR